VSSVETHLQFRADVLKTFGAGSAVAAEILAYDAVGFGEPAVASARFPLADEPFVDAWRRYRHDAAASDVRALSDRLVQLAFPIQQGISNTDEYRAVTRRGAPPRTAPSATGIVLERPHACVVAIYPTWAGAIPIVFAAARADFVSLVRAFTARNEPTPVPDAVGAWMVAGYNNWDRFRHLRDRWMADHPDEPFSIDRVAHLTDLYRDRFILLSDGWYSGVLPEQMDLAPEIWRDLSVRIRREHECAHYWTRRVCGSMRNRVLDEVVADYCGIVVACGRFRADWFLKFFGLENFPACRETGRLHHYRGEPPLSDEAFAVIQKLVFAAAEHLEVFTRRHANELAGPTGVLRALLTLTTATLEDLASLAGARMLSERLWRYGTAPAGAAGMLAVS
jgi:uncharacterized protein DUF7005